ncbi:MAG: sigma-70 family RNA polymerase sigma factor [Armatimonadetes bacterium]|nr:sigma-70 family RNA polymerase sigma factor [Armatimonadota bacterium]
MSSEEKIIRLVKSGRNDEFRKLVSKYQRQAMSLAYRMLGNVSDAEDATQDAFVSAFRSINTYGDGGYFWPWLRRIVINCCLKRMSRQIAMEDVDSIEDLAQPCAIALEDEVIQKCELETIRKVISELAPIYRVVAVLRYQQDLSTVEIAEMLDLPAGTVRVRLHRALKLLNERLVVDEYELR